MLEADEQEIESMRWKKKYSLLKKYVGVFKREETGEIGKIEKCLTQGDQLTNTHSPLNN